MMNQAFDPRTNTSAVAMLVLPFPPSLNTYWRHLSKGPLAGRTLISQKGRAYRVAVAQTLLASHLSSFGVHRLRIDIEARMPDRRARDLDNLPKAVLDALTHAGLYEDDEQIDDLRIWRSPRKGGELVLTISVLPAMTEQGAFA